MLKTEVSRLFYRNARALGAISFLLLGGCAANAPQTKLDVVQELRAFNRSLIQQSPSQAAGKFRKMQRDLISFNRGSNHLFYRFVERRGLPQRWMGPLSSRATLHGDFHVENIGAYEAGGKMVVDLIDFDDGMQGPVLLDVYRCASSLIISARTDRMRERVVKAFVQSYVATMRGIASGAIATDVVVDESSSFALARGLIREAMQCSREDFFTGFARCRMESGKRIFGICASYERLPMATAQALMRSYLAHRERAGPVSPEQYGILDAAVDKGSGIGSSGVFKVRVLVRGVTDAADDDRILEFKQECAPQGEKFAAKTFAHQGERVLDSETAMQTLHRPEIGAAHWEDKYFFVSEMSVRYQELNWGKLVGSVQMTEAATLAGFLLAKGHARSRVDSGEEGAVAREMSDLLKGDGQEEAFLREVMDFCAEYAACLQKGYEQFSKELTFSPLL